MNCKACGNELSPGAKFCPACGASQEAEATPQVPRCKKCGNELTPGAKFCPACGASQEAEAAPQVPHCKKCGNELAPGVKFCPVCGASQEPGAGPQTPQRAPAPQSAQTPQSTPKKKGSLLRILVPLLAVVVVFFGFSFVRSMMGQKAQQDRLSNYIQKDLAELEDMKDQIAEDLDDALWKDEDLETGIKHLKDVKKLCADLVLKVLDVNTSLDKDSELAEVNSRYSRFAKKSSDAVDYMISALEDGNSGESTAQKAKSMLEDANEEYSEFQKKLADLAKEREVDYRQNDELPFEDALKGFENIH